MKTIHKHALIACSAERMYDLVNDIDSYEEFLPWCGSSKVLSADADSIRATIEIAHGGLRKSFTTRNYLQKYKMIEMRLESGPFRHLEGLWRFQALDEQACKVSLDLEFEFGNRLIGLALGPIFNTITNTLVDAFCTRAINIYGRDQESANGQ